LDFESSSALVVANIENTGFWTRFYHGVWNPIKLTP